MFQNILVTTTKNFIDFYFYFSADLKRPENFKLFKLDLDLSDKEEKKTVIESKGENSLPLDSNLMKNIHMFVDKTVGFLKVGGKEELALRKFVLPYLDFQKTSSLLKDIILKLGESVLRGQMVSYQELGELSGYGSHYYSRVVARAMASNPFPLIFPCHRVILKSGKLASKFGVRGGVKVKQYLLSEEGIISKGEVYGNMA